MVYAFADWFGRADSREFVEYWKEYTARHGGEVLDSQTGQAVAWGRSAIS